MAFALSGSVITQTGTDNDLSGLVGIAGVDSIRSGVDLTHSQNVYDIGGLLIDIKGTLSIDAMHEMIISGPFAADSGVRVSNGGVLNVNGKRSFNGTDRYSESLWLHCTDEDRWQDVGLEVRNGGTLNWIGGGAFIPRGVEFDTASTVYIEQATLDMATTRDDNSSASSEHQIRQSSNNLTVNGFKLKRGSFTLISIPVVLDSYAPEHCDRAFGFSSLTPNIDIPIPNYNTDVDNNQDVALWAGARPVFTNAVNGTAMDIGPNSGGNSLDYGFVVVRQEFNPLIIDSSSTPIEGAAVWLSDYDNGARETYTQEGYLTSPGLQVDPNQTFIYAGVTIATGSLDNILTVNTGFNAVNAGAGFFTPNEAPALWDYRGRTNDTSDEFEIFVASYNHGLDQYVAVLKGAGVVTTGTTLFVDTLITELDASVTAQQTIQDTAEKTYDGLKYVLVTNYNGERKTIVSRSGVAVLARDYDVRIDSAGSGLPTFDGGLITLNTNNFLAQGIATTGTVSADDGVDVTGSSFTTLHLDSGRDLTGVTADVLRFNDNSAGSYNLTNCTIGTIINDGTGVLEIASIDSVITDFSDAQINVTILNIRSLTLTGIEAGTKIYLVNRDLTEDDPGYEIDTALQAVSGDYFYEYNFETSINATVRIVSLDAQYIDLDLTLTGENQTIPISQQQDRIYENA